ncbi:MAG: AhpC/TSA family protein [Bacteroidetes bacterium]|nr:AhpC/TSA family protein [Bacteroidota bacterium]MCL6103075.1 AhpC/TSA family protein [Bacteroidota bacterium]
MKHRNKIIVIIILLTGFSCHYPKYHISGNISGMENGAQIMLFKFKGDTIFSVDTTIIKSGNFIFEGKEFLDDISIITAGNYPDKVKSAEVVLERGTINVRMDSVPFVSGTILNDAYNSYKKKGDDYFLQFEILRKNGKVPDLLPVNSEAYILTMKIKDYQSTFIADNIKNPVGRRIFKNRMKGNNLSDSAYQVIKSQIPKQFLFDKEIIDIVEFKRKEKEKIDIRNSIVGKKFVDVELFTPDNKSVRLSDYIGTSKFTLLEFWASWCAPCIAEVPNLKKVYTKYNDKGLNIISISMDTKVDDWQRGITQVNTPWVHLSELKGMSSNIAKVYGIASIPYALLLDKNGIIVEVNNLSGPFLDLVLKVYMAENKN